MQQMSPPQLAAWLADPARERPLLLDVRERWEFQTCHIEGAALMPMHTVPARYMDMDRNAPVVCICHHGMRSRQIAAFLERKGFSQVINLSGGMHGRSRSIRRCRPTDGRYPLIRFHTPENAMRNKLLAALIAGAVLSFDARAMDLLQAYRQALANDPVYASARAALAAGREKLPQGRAGLLPTLGVGGSYTRNDVRSDFSGIAADRNANTNSYTISLSQPLFRPANWEQFQEGKLSAAASEAQFAQAQQDLIVRVAQAYFDVLAAQDALASVQAQKVAITEQLASAKRNFEVGTATITDTHEAQARFDLAVAQEFAAVNDLEIKRAALEQIIGRPAGELDGLKAGFKLSAPQPADIGQWVQSAETQNYGVVGQQLALEIARREIRRNRAGHYPTVDLVASRSHSNQSGAVSAFSPGGITDSNSIGVQWSIPLFSGFAVTSRVREAIALEDKARSDLENARRSAAQGARQSYLSVSNGLAQVKALEAAEVSSRSALESNRLGYQVGVRINIDVLNAQQQLYTTRRDLAKARYDTVVNGLRLRAAAGSLQEDDLARVNSLLGPVPVSSTDPASSPSPSPAGAPARPRSQR